MNRKMFAGVVSALALALAACGGSSNPAAPSSPSSPSSPGTPAQAGATISGSVSGTTGGSASGVRALDTAGAITVTVSGTNVTVTVDGQGKFTLTGIPAGDVQLVFTSGGTSATLTLNGVQTTDKIVIKVTLKGTAVTLEDEERNGSPVTELEDQISAITLSTRTIVVRGTSVSVPNDQMIRHGGTTGILFTTLKVGDRVHVRGAMTGTTMVATEVNLQNTNTNPGVNVSGGVTKLNGGTCPSIEFVVSGWTIVTNANTDFQKNSCATIGVGTSVHVKGDVQAATGKVLATSVQVK